MFYYKNSLGRKHIVNYLHINALIAHELLGFTCTDNELKIFSTALGGLVWYWDISFIAIELMQVQANPDN